MLTDKQYRVLLFVRNREFGTPDGSPFEMGEGTFLRKAGFTEIKQNPFSGFWNVVTFLGHVAMAQYETNTDR